MTHWRQLTLWGLALKTWQGETFLSLFKECQISNFPSWDHVFAMKIKKTAWLLMAPVRGVRQRSQWCFLPLCPSDCCQLCFLSLLFFFYSAGWRLVHLPSLKQSYENLFVFPANNPFTIGCNFHTRPGFQSSVLELWLLIWPVNWCGRCILDSTFIGFCPIDHQVSLLRKHHHSVLPLNSHTFFSAVVNSIWQVIGFVPATWW